MNSTLEPSAEASVIYSINESDFLIQTNENWDSFAHNNDSSHLDHSHVLNHSLWDYITDFKTRHIHKVIVKRVRQQQASVSFDFRCDSPSTRRYMNMKIVPNSTGTVTYECTIERIEERTPIDFTEQKLWRDKKSLKMCSWCKKVDLEPSGWVEIEDAIHQLQLLERNILPELIHTMCDSCLLKIEDELT